MEAPTGNRLDVEDASSPPPGAELHRLDPRYVPYARVGGALLLGGMTLASAIGLMAWAIVSQPGSSRLVALGALLAVVVGAVALVVWLHPPLELRHARWRLSERGLEIRKGVWFRRIVSVPRNRVQHTDVKRGPIERRYGLATLVVHTAGHQNSEVRIEGLPHEEALWIRDRLLRNGAPEEGAGDGC